MGKIFYLMGKSASGKDTLYKMILEKCPQLRTVVLYTTRPMREGETEGVEYHFVTQNQMEELKRQGKIVEIRTYNTVCGPWSYATVNDGQINLNEWDYLAIGTLESYEQTCNYYGKETVVPLYVTVDPGVRLQRALERERQQKAPNYSELCRRYLADEADFAPERLKKLGINGEYLNDSLRDCLKEMVKRIEGNV